MCSNSSSEEIRKERKRKREAIERALRYVELLLHIHSEFMRATELLRQLAYIIIPREIRRARFREILFDIPIIYSARLLLIPDMTYSALGFYLKNANTTRVCVCVENLHANN